MKSVLHPLWVILLLVGFAVPASADITLFEYALNLNGTIYDSLSGTPAPANVNLAGFDTNTGLGTITITYQTTAVGDYFIGLFLDQEIDEVTNTFFNEYGSVVGTPTAGLTWEIDEPGYVFGDIYSNFTAGLLDNANAVPAGAPNDVSMAMGWRFAAAAGDTATISFNVSQTPPASAFYLSQTDPDSNVSIYTSTNLTVGQATVPEPGVITMLLFMGAVLALAARFAFGKRRLWTTSD